MKTKKTNDKKGKEVDIKGKKLLKESKEEGKDSEMMKIM